MIEVHVYRVTGATAQHFADEKEAISFARKVFNERDVYKVKVWDLSIAEPSPNLVNAPGLILELV